MPKRATVTARTAITLDATLEMPLYKQLYGRLRGAILAGQLPRGERLPSTRTLASELGVSRGTTVLAYEQLLLEGYLESRVGQGTSVSHRLPAILLRQPVEQPGKDTAKPLAEAPLRLAPRVDSLQAAPNLSPVEGSGGGAFRGGQPALDLFPYELWARLLARRARKSLASVAYYQPPAGYPPLREAIAAHIGITRGVRCTAEQIILTAGTQGALDLAVRTLLAPGEEVWLENPAYFGARGALLAGGARLVPVPVDAEGLDVEAGRNLAPAARLAFVTPSHQYPTGVTMSLRRRLELLDWAKEAESWVLEDDYDSEYRFGGRPLEALQALDRAGRVLYIGSFSKLLFPSLRLGYLVAPEELVEPLLTTRRFTDGHLPILEQMVLADFLHEGHFARHLRRMLRHYRQRRNCLLRELRTHLDGLLEISVPEAGMELVGWLPPGKDDNRAVELAAAAGISVAPISRFSLEPLPRGGLVLGFGSVDEQQIRVGVRTLAAALREL
jgi:GntR family transcriptional regulator/MocR family aminotransferase